MEEEEDNSQSVIHKWTAPFPLFQSAFSHIKRPHEKLRIAVASHVINAMNSVHTPSPHI